MKVQFYDALEMTIPKGYAALEPEQKKAVYGATPMDYAYGDMEKNVAVGVIRTGTPLANDMVENQIAAYQQYYSRMVPGFTMGQLRKTTLDSHTLCVMSYKSNAPTRDMFNIVALTSLGEKEVVFLCSCNLNDALTNMPLFSAMLRSLVFLGE